MSDEKETDESFAKEIMAYAFESINESYAEERVFQHKANALFLMVLAPIVFLCWLIVSTTDNDENCRLSCYPNKVLECSEEKAVCSVETKTVEKGESARPILVIRGQCHQ